MAWSRYTHASISANNPQALGTCDRCGMVYQRSHLSFQYDWRGPRLQNLRILVCPTCLDQPQQNGQRTIILPPDPVPIMNPRPDPHMFMGQSSSPDPYQNGSPNAVATENNDPIVPLITVFLTPTDTSPWALPQGIQSIYRVEVLGGGGGGSGGSGNPVATKGGSGGGAGGYAKNSSVTASPGDTFNFAVGAKGAGGGKGLVGVAGGDTWFGGTGFADALVSAHGGSVGATPNLGGPGGTGVTGDVLYTGGSGGDLGANPSPRAAGGGGAAGANGNGANGGLGGATTGDGGSGDGGLGGAGGTGGSTPNGHSGTEFDGTYGSGGGGGGGQGSAIAGGIGGNYGAGGGGGAGGATSASHGLGGDGSDGIIAITYAQTSPLITEIGVTPTPTSSGYTAAST